MSEKPLCVECGSKQVISKGVSGYCKACGRWFLKNRRGDFLRRVGEHAKKEWERICRENGYQPIYGTPMIESELSYETKFIPSIAQKFGISPKMVKSAIFHSL